jgi:hypothetical protein
LVFSANTQVIEPKSNSPTSITENLVYSVVNLYEHDTRKIQSVYPEQSEATGVKVALIELRENPTSTPAN